MLDALVRLGYQGAARAARSLAAIAPKDSTSKIARSLAGRRGLLARYHEWGRGGRDRGRALVWFHAPSVGEGLQARPVIERLRARRPDVQIAYTHFSPSAVRFAASLDADFHDYLPFDVAGDMDEALAILDPAALIFSKLDVWPALVARAGARGTKLGLISGTVARGSRRGHALVRPLMQPAYARLDSVGAIDDEDAARLIELGVRAAAVRVTGDTRYDQVWERAERTTREHPILAPLVSTRPTLVAGSTWPADEAVLLPAWETLRAAVQGSRLVIAPHEPTPAHLDPIVAWAGRSRCRWAFLDERPAADADVVIVNRVGVLGDLYRLADVAYVGGGFHGAGLHSVLEPAAYGAPVLFGPRGRDSRDARLLAERGGGVEVTDAESLKARLEEWLKDGDRRVAAGERAHALVRDGLGAAERSLDLVLGLLPEPTQAVSRLRAPFRP